MIQPIRAGNMKFLRERKKRVPFELDITSLLDILVILLVFLLKSYSAAEIKIDFVKHLLPPQSNSEILIKNHIVLQINKDGDLWAHNKKLGNINTSGSSILFLSEFLNTEKNKVVGNTPKDKKKAEIINLIFDGELPYSQMKKVMNTAATAGYPQFKLIVRSDYK